ncbi:Protein of unknown function [Amycolatopsis xylanica]|uniref:DUF2795 domain-containing protein n=1 Tax=Amycolatopsis xylanica TaxID=589385 RepID=A0A1H3JWD1_9PSEU|nr:DUF2795 domain-containing protein [Amycolatopsis xylanica]SDY43574.1 Protein of unknown function [Amycolatopsis xylanica]
MHDEIDWAKYVGGADYPCGRDVLLKSAAAQGGDDEVLGQLGKLPEREYDCFETVRTSLGS